MYNTPAFSRQQQTGPLTSVLIVNKPFQKCEVTQTLSQEERLEKTKAISFKDSENFIDYSFLEYVVKCQYVCLERH